MKILPRWEVFFGVLFCATPFAIAAPTTRPSAFVPIVNIHAHNDYEHEHPLFDALRCGIWNVEADIHLVDGKLLVAHDLKHAKPDRTLQSLYLDPLRQMVQQYGGRVARDAPSFTLLIDFKSDPAQMWPVLRDVLKDYEPLLTHFSDGQTKPGAITIILTGNHPREAVENEKQRYVALDAVLTDLDRSPPPPASLYPWISTQWSKSFQWNGVGQMPGQEQQKLRALVARAHAQGRQIRFWGAPDNVTTWTELRAAGVDLLNTDDLQGCQAFMLQQLNGGQSRKALR